jgi:hypothetical protein
MKLDSLNSEKFTKLATPEMKHVLGGADECKETTAGGTYKFESGGGYNYKSDTRYTDGNGVVIRTVHNDPTYF